MGFVSLFGYFINHLFLLAFFYGGCIKKLTLKKCFFFSLPLVRVLTREIVIKFDEMFFPIKKISIIIIF